MHNNAKQSKRKRQTKDHIAYLRLDDEALRGLRQIAEREERPVSFVMREAIREYIRAHGAAA
jgi:predicted transcriptional regulator